MAIKNNYPPTALNRKIDQAYEMAGLARQDGDMADSARWLAEVERLKKEGAA